MLFRFNPAAWSHLGLHGAIVEPESAATRLDIAGGFYFQPWAKKAETGGISYFNLKPGAEYPVGMARNYSSKAQDKISFSYKRPRVPPTARTEDRYRDTKKAAPIPLNPGGPILATDFKIYDLKHECTLVVLTSSGFTRLIENEVSLEKGRCIAALNFNSWFIV